MYPVMTMIILTALDLIKYNQLVSRIRAMLLVRRTVVNKHGRLRSAGWQLAFLSVLSGFFTAAACKDESLQVVCPQAAIRWYNQFPTDWSEGPVVLSRIWPGAYSFVGWRRDPLDENPSWTKPVAGRAWDGCLPNEGCLLHGQLYTIFGDWDSASHVFGPQEPDHFGITLVDFTMVSTDGIHWAGPHFTKAFGVNPGEAVGRFQWTGLIQMDNCDLR